MGSVGVSREADLVYRYLSQGGAGTVRVIAQSLGMPVRQLRQSLEELSDLGAVIRRTLGGTARWTAAAPPWSRRKSSADTRRPIWLGTGCINTWPSCPHAESAPNQRALVF